MWVKNFAVAKFFAAHIFSVCTLRSAGTGTPQFGGLTARQVLDLLRGLFAELNIIGMDVVEVAPKLDPSLAALFAARKIVTECWGHHYFKNIHRA